MSAYKRLLGVLLLSVGWLGFGAEVIPPAPAKYFNDYARAVSPATATRLNTTLENFERETSSQVIVAIFPKMQSDSSIEDYTIRVAQSWRVGQKEKNNGAVLFVFIQDRKMFLQVGYGLEGALPDALCKRIIEDEIKPHFRNQDFDGGMSAGVAAILAATKGEYHGTGRTTSEGGPVRSGSRNTGSGFPAVIIFFLLFGVIAFLSLISRKRRGGYYYTSSGWGSSGGGWSSGGGGGGGFSGGGGSFGGGGAGGSW